MNRGAIPAVKAGGMMSVRCLRVRRKVGAYLDTALPEPEARVVGHHLEACERCRGEARGQERMRTLLRSAVSSPAAPERDEFWSGVRARLLSTDLPARRALRLPLPWWPVGWAPRVAVAGASVLLLALVLWQGLPRREGPRPGVVVRAIEAEHPVMVFSTPEQEMTVIWVFGLAPTSDRSFRFDPGVEPVGAVLASHVAA